MQSSFLTLFSVLVSPQSPGGPPVLDSTPSPSSIKVLHLFVPSILFHPTFLNLVHEKSKETCTMFVITCILNHPFCSYHSIVVFNSRDMISACLMLNMLALHCIYLTSSFRHKLVHRCTKSLYIWGNGARSPNLITLSTSQLPLYCYSPL